MIFIEPEACTAYEKFPYLIFPVIKYIAIPFGMKSLSRIGILIEVGAIKIDKSMLVVREMGWYPVKDNTDTLLMKIID